MNNREFKNLSIDETFILGNRKFKIEEKNDKYSCEGCFFHKNNLLYDCPEMIEENIIPECFSHQRTDDKAVIFIEVKENI